MISYLERKEIFARTLHRLLDLNFFFVISWADKRMKILLLYGGGEGHFQMKAGGGQGSLFARMITGRCLEEDGRI